MPHDPSPVSRNLNAGSPALAPGGYHPHAYSDGATPRGRGATVVTVALLHIGLGYAIVSGFGATVIQTVSSTLEGRNIPAPMPMVDLPPLPEPDPSEASEVPRDPVLTVADSRIDLPRTDSFEVRTGPLVIPDTVFDTIPIEPRPSATATGYAPRGAVARNDPAGWVGTNDYPSREIRMGVEGSTGFRLQIGTDGRVDSCTVTRSSGSAGLDAATCKFVSKRARFEPATGADGKPVAGQYENTIRWVLPD